MGSVRRPDTSGLKLGYFFWERINENHALLPFPWLEKGLGGRLRKKTNPEREEEKTTKIEKRDLLILREFTNYESFNYNRLA